MLKFEGKFKVGDQILSYDFQPMAGRPDSYLVGTVIEEKNTEHGFSSYKVVITERVFAGEVDKEETGTFGWVPHEVSIMEYDNRIRKVA